MDYNYDNLKGTNLLRADPLSQKLYVNHNNQSEVLVDNKKFWGDSNTDGLYYDFESDDNTGYTVLSEGWADYSENPSEKLSKEQTKVWIEDHILSAQNDNICIIQGYAGCGKTVFVNKILRDVMCENNYHDYHNFYIGHVEGIAEGLFIANTLQQSIAKQIIERLTMDDGLKVYDMFVKLFTPKIDVLSPILSGEVLNCFRSKTEGSLYYMAKTIYENRKKNNINEAKDEYISQFTMSYKSLEYKLQRYRYNSDMSYKLPIDILLFVDILWHCAISLIETPNTSVNKIIVYDNLDIIDNHHVVADFIDTLRAALMNYSTFKTNMSEQYALPTFKLIVTVRKITYAAVSKFKEVGNCETQQNGIDVDFIDISNIYANNKLLKHKAKVLSANIEQYLPSNAKCFEKINTFLKEVVNVSDDIFDEIKFSDLFNHNLRACSNMLERIIEHYDYKLYFGEESVANMPYKCKAAIWINIICSSLKDLEVWDSLGYNTSSKEMQDNPTTLSRLILTLLRNHRMGHSLMRPEYTSMDVSLQEIVTNLEKIPFMAFQKNTNWDDIKDSLKDNYKKENTHNYIVNIITKMFQRNNSWKNLELWRRPIYYTHNAFPLNDDTEIKSILSNQINNPQNCDNKLTHFCITDEGNTFVEKIATHFEFYSVRFNNRNSIPLCCITDVSKLSKTIKKVYTEIQQCLLKQLWIMEYYTNGKDENKNDYLMQIFHPRTVEFLPQLHIVRTIYDHINYLSEYRDYICENAIMEKTKKDELNKCILSWINKYLQLYKEFLFDKLIGTVGEYNNEIWLELKYLYWLVYSDENLQGCLNDIKYIKINRYFIRNFSDDANYKELIKTKKQELLENAMELIIDNIND